MNFQYTNEAIEHLLSERRYAAPDRRADIEVELREAGIEFRDETNGVRWERKT